MLPMPSLEDQKRNEARATTTRRRDGENVVGPGHRVDNQEASETAVGLAAAKRSKGADERRDLSTTTASLDIAEKVDEAHSHQQGTTARERRRIQAEYDEDSVSSSIDDEDEQAQPGAVSVPGIGFSRGVLAANRENSVTGQQQSSSNVVAVPMEAILARENEEIERLEAAKEALRRELEEQRDNTMVAAAEIVAADEFSPEASSTTQRALLLTFVAAVVGVAIILVMALLPDKNGDQNDTAGLRDAELLRLFFPVARDMLSAEDLPQSKAVEWLANDEFSASLVVADLENQMVLEENALAALCFSTGNNSTEQTGWSNTFNFLEATSVCEWKDDSDAPVFGVTCDDSSSSTMHVQLSSTELKGVLPTKLPLLKSLTDMSVVDNQLVGKINSEIGLLRLLQGLDIRNNALSGNMAMGP